MSVGGKTDKIDTGNKFMVMGKVNGEILVGRPPGKLTPDEALGLAAYLVCIAEPHATHKFVEVLQAIQST